MCSKAKYVDNQFLSQKSSLLYSVKPDTRNIHVEYQSSCNYRWKLFNKVKFLKTWTKLQGCHRAKNVGTQEKVLAKFY